MLTIDCEKEQQLRTANLRDALEALQ